MRGTVAIMLIGAALCSGCSGDGEPTHAAVAVPPTVAEAERAIKQYSQSNVATGPVRAIECGHQDGVAVCSVDFDDACSILTVNRQAGKLIIGEASEGLCSHLRRE
jgi:hypothetical protein